MTDEEIRQLASEAVMEILELEPHELRDDALFDADLGSDSIQRLSIVDLLQKRFGIKYALCDEARLNSINEVTRITRSYLVR